MTAALLAGAFAAGLLTAAALAFAFVLWLCWKVYNG